jgi:uncharacterized repeat protein (TIGR01451 family)
MKRTRVALAIIGIAMCGLSAASASGADRTIPLGAAGNFSVLAGTTVANTGLTVVTGDLGISPGTALTGFPPGVITGAEDLDDPAATQAQTALSAAYAAAGNVTELPCEATITGNLGGRTLTPGVYCAEAAIGITGTLTLNFQGNPNAFFLFRINAALTTAAASAVHVTNTGAGAETCAPNTFWALNGAAGFGAATDFTGTILANGGFTSGAGTTTGQVLVNGAVTVNSNSVAVCPNPIPPSAHLSVTATGPPDPVAPGAYILYPITATNAGPDSASDVSLTAMLPIGLDFGAMAAPAGWSCTTPALGTPGTVTCTAPSFAAGVADFGLTAKAYPGITTDTTLSLPTTVSSATGDADETELSSTILTHVVLPVIATPTPTEPIVAVTPATIPAATTPTPLASALVPAIAIPAPPSATTPATHDCISHRRFTLRLSTQQGSRRGVRIVKAVLLNAKHQTLKTLDSTPTSIDVDLRGLSGQMVTVRVTTRPRAGAKTSSFTRIYEACS